MKRNINTSLFKEVEKANNFSDILNVIAKKFPKKIFLVERNKKINFEDFNILVNKCCNFFLKNKIKKKEIVTLNLSNSLEFIILYFASIRYGSIINPIPYGTKDENLKYNLKISKSKIFFTRKIFKNNKIKNFVINDFNDFLDKINQYDYKSFSNKKINSKDIAVLYFSSGTTQKSKLIKYSHLAMVNNQKMMVRSNFLNNFSTHMCILPLGHTASLRYTIKNALITGGKVYIYKNFWEVKDSFWKEIEKHSINFVGLVPTILQTILVNSKAIKKKLKHLKFIGCGSSILPKTMQDSFEKKFKIKVSNLYGMSEVGLCTFDNPNKKTRKTGTIGDPLKGVTIKLFKNKKIMNDNNIVGEIGIKTPAMFSGYVGLNKSKKTFINKYFLSGDLAKRINENIFFVDRNKDIIIKGGINISPQEIDNCLQAHSSIKESATIGIKDNFFGENIKSYIVLLKNKKVREREVLKYCKGKLGFFKSPIDIQIINELPKTQSGKILKRLLKNN